MAYSRSSVLILLVCFLAITLQAQVSNGTNAPNRPLALDESNPAGAKHNYNVQIGATPRIARFNLESSYGYYDPTLRIGRSGQAETTTPS